MVKQTILVAAVAGMVLALAPAAQASTIFTGAISTDWEKVGNWDNGLPSGSVDVIIQAGKEASSTSFTPSTSTGSLTVNAGAVVRVDSNLGGVGEGLVVTTPSSIIFNGGTLNLSTADTLSFPAISLVGTGTFTADINTGDSKTRNLNNAISGSGLLTIEGRNKQYWNFGTSNSFSGGLALAAIDRYAANFNVSGSGGTGDVTVTPRSSDARSAVVVLNASDVFADTATLTLNGKGAYNSTGWTYGGVVAIDMKTNNDTIAGLIVDGVTMAPGDYTGTSGAWIQGTGILTVLPEPATLALMGLGGLGLVLGRKRR